MLADPLRRLLVHLAGGEPAAAPELLEVERRAAVAMAPCTCGHMWHLHEHPHVRTGCDACRCPRFRPAQPPPPVVATPQLRPADAAVVRLRVAWWTRARRGT